MSFALALALGLAHAGADRPRVALSVSPARIVVGVPGSRRIELRNTGKDRVVVDLRSRAIGPRTAAKAWLKISPRTRTLAPATKGIFTIRVKSPRHAQPGDHYVLVLVTTRPRRDRGIAVRMRLGVRMRLRVPGRIVRRVELRRLRVARRHGARVIRLTVANRGNVTVQLGGRLTLSLMRRGHVVARLHRRSGHALLPGAKAVVPLRYRGGLRGLVTIVANVRLGPRLQVERRYRIRL